MNQKLQLKLRLLKYPKQFPQVQRKQASIANSRKIMDNPSEMMTSNLKHPEEHQIMQWEQQLQEASEWWVLFSISPRTWHSQNHPKWKRIKKPMRKWKNNKNRREKRDNKNREDFNKRESSNNKEKLRNKENYYFKKNKRERNSS